MSRRPRVTSASPYELKFGFCRGLRTGNLVSIAGTAPIGSDGKTVGVGDAAAQARRCFEIIEQALNELGAELTDVVRTRMFLTQVDDWPEIGAVHGEFFGAAPPVATMVAVAALIDPDWRIEIEADAVLEPST